MCLVEAQGGRMWAESVTGEGSTIYVSLPVVNDRRDAD
jgi:signal transduction histidine kinase